MQAPTALCRNGQSVSSPLLQYLQLLVAVEFIMNEIVVISSDPRSIMQPESITDLVSKSMMTEGSPERSGGEG